MKKRPIYRYRRQLLLILFGISLIGAFLIINRWSDIYLRYYNRTIILHDILPSKLNEIIRTSTLGASQTLNTTLPHIRKWNQRLFSIGIMNLTSSTAKTTQELDGKETKYNKNTKKEDNKTIIILFYNPPGWMTFSSHDSFDSCEYNNCRFSTDMGDYIKSDAVVFTGQILPEKPKKMKDQIWIYENIESPVHTSIPEPRWTNVINWTLTYRRDSDFVAPYRFVVKGSSPKFGKSLDISEILRNKTKSTAWFVSNCITSSRRENYVNELKLHTDVDIYGNCGSLKCTKDEECREMLTQKYYFYLSFENSFCHDYITEKALVNLRQIVIPIVRGSAYYDLYMPPNSFIDARKFSSKKSLASFMKVLKNNVTFYKQYQNWHKFYHIQEDHMFHDSLVACKLCKHLNSPEKYQRVYNDIHEWWHGNENKRMCEKSGAEW